MTHALSMDGVLKLATQGGEFHDRSATFHDRKGVATMKTFAFRWIGLMVVLAGSLVGGASAAQAQGFGLSYNSPGFSLGINQPAYYGGYYPVAPVVVPRPVVVAPGYYGPRPFYPGYGYGYRGPYHGGYGYGGHGYPHYR